MVRQIPGEISEQLVEQAKHTASAAQQAPGDIFRKMAGQKTATEEKAAVKDKGQKDTEKLAGGAAGQQQQQALSSLDLRRQQIKAEKEAHLKKMRKILHQRLFAEAQKARERKIEGERLQKMEEEKITEEKKKKKMEALVEKEKEEALAVQMLKREKGAGEFGPRKVQ